MSVMYHSVARLVLCRYCCRAFEGKYKHRRDGEGRKSSMVSLPAYLAANDGAEKKKFDAYLELIIKHFIEKQDRFMRLGLASMLS